MTGTRRFRDEPVADGGTAESTWDGHTRFPDLDLDRCPALVLVAPHPDDEVLGFGAAACALARLGRPVTIVSVTDGEASHPGSPTVEPAGLAALRRTESERAAARLGLDVPIRFGFADGDVESDEDALAHRIRDLLAPGTWCAAPFRHDGHPDHEAVGRAAAKAAAAAGAVLIEYPIWLWHWSFPGDPDVPWDRARTVHPPRECVTHKRAAVAEFVTQITDLSDDPADRAVLPAHVLAHLQRDHETVFVS